MNKINHTEFMKKVFKKGKFEQYAVSPYASEESFQKKVLILSDKVEEPTYYYYRRAKMALILPYSEDKVSLMKTHTEEIMSHTGIAATFFGIFDLNSKRKLFTI